MNESQDPPDLQKLFAELRKLHGTFRGRVVIHFADGKVAKIEKQEFVRMKDLP